MNEAITEPTEAAAVDLSVSDEEAARAEQQQQEQQQELRLDILRFEQALLLSERRFLEQEIQASPDVYARMTTSRRSTAAVECELLQSYLAALQAGDRATCKVLDEKMRGRVEELRAKATALEKLLRGIRREVRVVLDHSTAARAL